MRSFNDEAGRGWIADAREEDTPRHHGRWYLVFRSAEDETAYPMPEVRWQNRRTAHRTIHSMSEFELRRRLVNVLGRAPRAVDSARETGADAGRRAEVLKGAYHA